MANTQDTKLKILCVHGYRQTDQSFRERTGAFRKIPIIKKSTELVFVSAPNRVPPLPNQDGDTSTATDKGPDDGQRGWWFSAPDNTYMAQDYTDCCSGYAESLDVLQKVFEEQGPFDGILAFSQGAAMVSLLCGIQQQDPTCVFQFNFVILVAGFRSRQSAHTPLYEVPIAIPSLHVFGDTDRVIEREMSEDLLPCFVEPKVLRHEGGHFIPVSGPHKKVYTEFLSEMLAKKSA